MPDDELVDVLEEFAPIGEAIDDDGALPFDIDRSHYIGWGGLWGNVEFEVERSDDDFWGAELEQTWRPSDRLTLVVGAVSEEGLDVKSLVSTTLTRQSLRLKQLHCRTMLMMKR